MDGQYLQWYFQPSGEEIKGDPASPISFLVDVEDPFQQCAGTKAFVPRVHKATGGIQVEPDHPM